MSFLSDYIDWHYFRIWPRLLLIWRNAVLFPIYYFSILLHLSTLFTPWKRQKAQMGVGFHIDDLVYVLTFNIFARIIGATVRTVVILYGLVFVPFLFLIFGIPALIWVVLPGLSLPLYLAKSPAEEMEAKYLLDRSKKSLKKLLILLFRQEEGLFICKHLNLDYQNVMWYLGNQTNEGDFADLEKNLGSSNSSTWKESFNKLGTPSRCLNTPGVSKAKLKLADLFLALAKIYHPFTDLIARNKLHADDVYQTANWYELIHTFKISPLIFDLQRIKSLPGIGVNWAYGYTVEFDKYSSDLTGKLTPYPILVGRDKEINLMERVLSKTETNNILLVGEPGVGRHILVTTLAHRIAAGNCPPCLSHKRVLELDMHTVISARPSMAEVKGLISDLLMEAIKAGNIIIAIDDIEEYLGGTSREMDFTDIFEKFALSSVGFIGITNPEGYHTYIDRNPANSALFEKIEIPASSPETVLTQLEVSIVPILEKKYDCIITYPAIRKTIDDSDKYLSSTPFPAKAIELLDEACIMLEERNKVKVLTPQFIDEFLSEKLNIPLGEIKRSEKEKLLNLENEIHKRVINQEEAISLIASSMRRSRLSVSSNSRPIGSFLFLGPTGVGKTETAKAFAHAYFGKEDCLLRFDMSQYQKEEGIERLIGSVKSGTPGELVNKIKDRPFSLLLLDEFEKSDPQIYNLFLTLIDEGYITSANGKRIEARNIIIIATSNAGAEFIREKINSGQSASLQKELIDYIQKERIFSPELINRFDAVVVFKPLTEGHLREVAKLMLTDLNKRLTPKEISVKLTPLLIRKLAAFGFDPVFGGRAIKRVISEKVEDQIARRLLKGEINRGEEVEITLE